jgi:hypothetical protein
MYVFGSEAGPRCIIHDHLRQIDLGARIMDRVSWMVRQTGIKDPAAWIAFDMARVEAAPASVKPEAPVKVALPIAVRQNPVELEPVKLGATLAKTSVASPLALETGIKDPAAWIATDMPGVKTALASVEPEAPLKVALPVAVRQNPVEVEPVKLRTAPAKTSNASPMALEKAIVIARQFLALQKGRKQPSDDGRHFGLVVDDKDAVRRALAE